MGFILNVLVGVVCFIVIFFIGRFNLETAFMFALFVAVFAFKKMDSKVIEFGVLDSNNSKDSNSVKDSNAGLESSGVKSSKDSNFLSILYQCVIATFCSSIINTNEWQKFVVLSILALVFIRIYDYFKPSFIGRFYDFNKFQNSQVFVGKNSKEFIESNLQDSKNIESKTDSNIQNKKTTLLTNAAFYRILSAILNGILSAISALIVLKLLQNFGLDKYISTFLV
ncbi:hypothetical protein DCO58_03635 [Helicobacter saguini]|uniref:Uncharacterized protein n=1 Tax=Helicobacter saguini TaxID=1548018 RepID=A0A6L7D4Q4_9HELI|nr:hypothetical protein [Helicobacter saguini]MWV62543.1 hypothetical protein [Helicobacter saguini]MWV66783.1 hypothetical protein [Helicobacter saguini]MWV69134.1 hypothetical protein [Helicobacter saguini]MWV71311.1 hypothetical protein [Helicobacter saguini]